MCACVRAWERKRWSHRSEKVFFVLLFSHLIFSSDAIKACVFYSPPIYLYLFTFYQSLRRPSRFSFPLFPFIAFDWKPFFTPLSLLRERKIANLLICLSRYFFGAIFCCASRKISAIECWEEKKLFVVDALRELIVLLPTLQFTKTSHGKKPEA